VAKHVALNFEMGIESMLFRTMVKYHGQNRHPTAFRCASAHRLLA
jgi:hypothetical protein